MKKLGFALAVLAMGSAPAVADLMTVGAPVEWHSWYQDFTLADTWRNPEAPQFDKMGIEMLDGSLESPGLTELTQPLTIASNVLMGGTTYDVAATGNNVSNLGFRLTFDGAITSSVTFNVVVWDWEKPQGKPNYSYVASGWEAAAWTWDAILGTGSWVIEDLSAQLTTNGGAVDLDVPPVPTPAAVLLGVLGLGVAGWRLRKFV